ncbi:MAG: DUF2461 domain-containing protein [Planctomycetota bacterium]
MPTTPAFAGFPLGMLHFFEELARHNNKKWFDTNKQRYETLVREPALQFIAAMAGPLNKVSPHFVAAPKKVGGSLMRVHRDVRFSRDKTPYKTNLGIQFRHEAGKDVHCPGFYLHVDTEQVFLGAGVWHPESAALAAIREAIDEDPAAWKRAKSGKAFRTAFRLGGDSLKRAPRGYDPEHPQIDDLKRKDHIAIAQLDHDLLFEPGLPKTIAAKLRASRAYVAFLCQAIGVEF